MIDRKIEVYIGKLNEFLKQEQQDFPDFRTFNNYKKQQIQCIKNNLLAQKLNVNPEDLLFAKHEYGKPYLLDHVLHFNHSHSQQYYALALSERVKDIGIDVEELDRKVRLDSLAQHAFHPDEYATWQNLEQDREYWFKVWTAKEAVLKASGLGIRLDLNTLNTQAHPINHGGLCSHELIGTFAYQNFMSGNMILTVAWRSEQSCRGFQFPSIQLHSLER
ncbi:MULTISPECIES: 4'-phosphopantetheinyl transferase family protein [Acinetobacter calcoaceticus/baumannii complex]|uniref:4'-phosphopantetheinyl transferase family protein n=1 Tax=Acinetobacter calcoaceticus/baumannii complex TaxID=909768 RepID=UPI00044583A7|nr:MULTISPECIES: 4'-phosphopantetheinyl transferase superfamily protein [Acinetobacter calcoaceticus/baumannii complex]AJB49449.1 ACP synthase [Acinetobacter nosocomialis]EXE80110.1 4'-phosphopantetheinyl transferase superfamily protein [Acinetobacter sp. 1566109]MBJ9959781.1 4'-phosphopantetheinyl transferase superfamily protein [Acinetobacter nosocomialis]MBR7739223.1 4'-phosphopantetheinyl transferase superfamily protein [Acinetobacter nosocomialis]MBR7750321.1 4'-phosphopantetheinyl transf